MKNMKNLFVLVVSFLISLPIFAKYEKKQDADYVREWCTQNNGRIQAQLANRLRADCMTESHAVEVDSVLAWKSNIHQAMKYGKASGKKAKFVAVIEYPHQLDQFEQAKQNIRELGLKVEIEKLENFKSIKLSRLDIPGPIVKKSKTGICHIKGCGSYAQTNSFKGYTSMNACLKSGGRKPKLSSNKLSKCEALVTDKTASRL